LLSEFTWLVVTTIYQFAVIYRSYCIFFFFKQKTAYEMPK